MTANNRLTFHSMRYRNFMGVGNQWVEIQLDANDKTIVYGKNGSGKSTLYEALFFCLFNKAFRKINKPELVNNINNKQLEVEVEFTASGTRYKVRRGIKPNIFEIYKDGEMVDQTSSSLDYQSILENNILKMGAKNSAQTMILGSKLYVPFMKLSAADRRALVEEILDIQIFSYMNGVAKTEVKELREAMNDIINQRGITENSIRMTKSHIDNLLVRNVDTKRKLEESIADYKAEITTFQKDFDDGMARGLKLKEELDALPVADTSGRQEIIDQIDFLQQNLSNFQSEIAKAQSEIDSEKRNVDRNVKRIQSDIKFYADNPVCPTCKQDIAKDHKHKHDAKFQDEIDALNGEYESLKVKNEKTIREYQVGVDRAVEEKIKTQSELDDFDAGVAKVNKARSDIERKMAVVRTEVINIQSNIKSRQSQITSTQSQIDGLDTDVDVTGKQDELKALESELKTLLTEYGELEVDMAEYDMILSLLKDDGIKKAIIKTYIPVINRLIRKYLDILGFNVGFTLDEQFKETISVVGRRDLSYGSFSAGEQMRIDLALLFAFREIPMMKGGNTTNLIIFDEIADSALDAEGWDAFFTIIDSIAADSNIFVLSPKGDELTGRFPNAIKFKKSASFTVRDDKV